MIYSLAMIRYSNSLLSLPIYFILRRASGYNRFRRYSEIENCLHKKIIVYWKKSRGDLNGKGRIGIIYNL